MASIALENPPSNCERGLKFRACGTYALSLKDSGGVAGVAAGIITVILSDVNGEIQRRTGILDSATAWHADFDVAAAHNDCTLTATLTAGGNPSDTSNNVDIVAPDPILIPELCPGAGDDGAGRAATLRGTSPADWRIHAMIYHVCKLHRIATGGANTHQVIGKPLFRGEASSAEQDQAGRKGDWKVTDLPNEYLTKQHVIQVFLVEKASNRVIGSTVIRLRV